MLGKLIKHEFKATWRQFIPVYIGLAVLTGAACIFFAISEHLNSSLTAIGAGFGMLIGIFGMIFVFISPYVFLSLRFYKTTATREAYLTFTVPAETRTILSAKFIVSYIWTVITMVLAWLALSIVIRNGVGEDFIETLFSLFDANSWFVNLLQVLSLALGFVNTLFAIFTAICLGQLVRDHRVIASIAFYAAIYTVQQIVNVIATLPYLLSELEVTESSVEYSTSVASSASSSDIPALVISIAISAVFIVAEYLLSNYLLKKKLNLL